MRTLFLDPASRRSGARRWWPIGVALAAAEVAALVAYVARPAEPGVTLRSERQLCLSRGEDQFDVRGEWPLTKTGADAKTLIASRCTLDPESFR